MGLVNPPSILIVQNDPDLRAFMVDTMHDFSAEVSSASTGRLATVMIAARHYDLALINATLPDMSGIALAGLAANEDIPAIMISNSSETVSELDYHGFPHLQRPFGPEELRKASRKAISESVINILKVKASVAVMETRLAAFRFDVAESHRILAELLARINRRNPADTGRRLC